MFPNCILQCNSSGFLLLLEIFRDECGDDDDDDVNV